MMEGIMFFAGNLSRRQSGRRGKAVFPFTTNASKVGYATSSGDEDDRGEIWLPIWKNFATFREIIHVFNEGRVQLNQKQAETGTEFARAITSLGAERGISSFQRISVVKRKGNAFLYINSGRIYASDEQSIHLLNELDPWYDQINKEGKSSKATISLKRLISEYDETILELCQYKKKEHLLRMLSTIGKLDRYASNVKNARPLQQLTESWLHTCYDESPEFRLAASMASIRRTNKIPSIRANLENVTLNKFDKWEYGKKSPSFVWNESSHLLTNISQTIYRRGIDGLKNYADQIPIDGTIPAKISDIIEFLNGSLNMKKIAELTLPLSIVSINSKTRYPWANTISERIDNTPIPEAYAVMKIVHSSEPNERIPYDMSVLSMLHARRFDDAYAKAISILVAHEMPPRSYSRPGGRNNLSCSDTTKNHLMASLLFPIHRDTRREIIERFIDTGQGT